VADPAEVAVASTAAATQGVWAAVFLQAVAFTEAEVVASDPVRLEE